jgi:hypothetical protein
MFKSVEYAELQNHPDLKAKAERATAALGGVIRSWREAVDVSWRPPASDSGAALELTLALSLPEAAASAAGGIRGRAFEPGEESLLRIDLREVWLNVLDSLIAQVGERVEDSFADPVGA